MSIEKQVFEPAQKLVKYFGTQDKTATALGVKQGTVSGWLNKAHGIDAINAQKAEKLTNGLVKASDLCPALSELDAY